MPPPILNCKILNLNYKEIQCGLETSTFKVNPNYGIGNITCYNFEGLLVHIINAKFNQDIEFDTIKDQNNLELSILINGQKSIQYNNFSKDLVQENLENYMIYANNSEKSIFIKDISIKEIRIHMCDQFIHKHQLNALLDIKKKFASDMFNETFILPLNSKVQDIALEILTDTKKSILKRLFLISKTLELITQYIQDMDNKTSFGSSDSLIKKIQKIEIIISSNLNQQISISQLSRKILLNEHTLKKEFKRVFGTSIFNYTTQLRMTKAKKLLALTNKPIYEISDIVGYKNSTHFTSAFKKNEQITPKNYRKKCTILVE